MERPAFSMMTSGDGSVGEKHHDAGPSNSSSVVLTSVRGGDGEGAGGEKKRKGARGTVDTKKRSLQDRSGAGPEQEIAPRTRKAGWSKDETDCLLQAYTEISQDKGRFRRTSVSGESFWEAVSQKVQGRSWKECQRRMDTLKKSRRVIEGKRLTQLNDQILRGEKLPTAMTVDWYNRLCEIKKGPGNARVVSAEMGPIDEGDYNNVPEQADPVPHQRNPCPDIVHLHPPEASNIGTTAGVDEQLHRIPWPAPPAQAPVPGAPVAAPPAPGSHKSHHDAHSPQPAVDAAAPELDIPCDFAPGRVGDVPSVEPEPHPDELVHKDGWIGDGTSTVPLDHLLDIDLDTDSEDLHEWTGLDDVPVYLSDFQCPTIPADDSAHMECTFDAL